MKISIKTEFLNEIDENEIELIIKAKEHNEKVSEIIDGVQKISKDISAIVAEKDNKVYVLNVDEIIKFYTKEQYTYCTYNNETYRVKKRLYELEEMLKNKFFLRILNSCIINVKQVECFDMGKVREHCCKIKK